MVPVTRGAFGVVAPWAKWHTEVGGVVRLLDVLHMATAGLLVTHRSTLTLHTTRFRWPSPPRAQRAVAP